MNKTVVYSVGIIALAAIACFSVYILGNRFAITNAGEGRIYKIDRMTGKSTLILQNREIPVVENKPKNESDDEKAIRLAKSSHTLKTGLYAPSNEQEIHSRMREMRGSLKIIGWEADRVDDQTFLVKYVFETAGGQRAYHFEVNTLADIVRNIDGDPGLEAKYGISR